MRKFIDGLIAVCKGMAEAIAILLFSFIMIIVLIGAFVWWVLPFNSRRMAKKVEEAQEARRKAAELKRRLEEEKARRDTEAAYKETAIRAKAKADMGEDPVAIANQIIKE